jgi:transposase
MEITREQFAQVEPYLPRQRGNVVHQNLAIINAILWLAENDCKWSALPRRFGAWHTVYTRVNRWGKAGVLDRVFEQMQRMQLIRLRLEIVGGTPSVELADRSGVSTRQAKRRPDLMDLATEPPKFTWVPRIRVCHRRRTLARVAGRRARAHSVSAMIVGLAPSGFG